jgi:hypothetical protein
VTHNAAYPQADVGSNMSEGDMSETPGRECHG